MSEEARKTLQAILSVIEITRSNFPADTIVRVEAVGKNTAAITVQAYQLHAILKSE